MGSYAKREVQTGGGNVIDTAEAAGKPRPFVVVIRKTIIYLRLLG